jgi:hypothetical protein
MDTGLIIETAAGRAGKPLPPLTGRKKEIWDMAELLTEEENPTVRDVAVMLEPARHVVDGIQYALKMAAGEIPRDKKPFREWLDELQEQIDRGEFEDDEED